MQRAEKEAFTRSVGRFVAAEIDKALDPLKAANEQLANDNRQLREQLDALTKRLDDMPSPQPGEPGTPGEKGDPGPPGAGLTDAVINRDGELVLTLNDGTSKNVGQVVGRDGDDGQPGTDGRDGDPGVDGKDADPEQIKAMINEALPGLVDKAQADLTQRIDKAIAEIPVPQDGQDGAPGEKGEPGPSGVGLTDAVINRGGELVLTLTDGATKNIGVIVGRDGAPGADGDDGQPGTDGRNGDPGVDGKDADPEQIKAMINEALPALVDKASADLTQRIDKVIAEIPVPQDGQDGAPGEKGEPGTDGKDADPEQIKAMINEALPALVDKAQADLTQRIDKAIAEIPVPKDGSDGLGFDDLRLEYDGERTLSLVFERGDQVHQHDMRIPALIDRGVWKAGEYEQGDVVTQGGSIWIARRDTIQKPGADNNDWRLSVKRGRDGKPAKPDREGEE